MMARPAFAKKIDPLKVGDRVYLKEVKGYGKGIVVGLPGSEPGQPKGTYKCEFGNMWSYFKPEEIERIDHHATLTF